VEGREEPAPEPVGGRPPVKTELEQQLADLQVQCNDNREALGRLKAQKEAAERRARIAAKAAETAQTSTPPASVGSNSNQGGSGQNQYRNQGNYRGRGRGRSQLGRSGACHNCGQQGHWANECPAPPASIPAPAPASAPQPPPSAPAPASSTQAVDYTPDRGWVQAEFRDEPIQCMIDTGIEWAVLGAEFAKGLPTLPARHSETLVCGVIMPTTGRSCISFRLAGNIMVARVDLIPGVQGLVLGQTWYRENACVWNVETGWVHAIDDITFQVEYDKYATLVSRAKTETEQPAIAWRVEADGPARPVEGFHEAEAEPLSGIGMIRIRHGTWALSGSTSKSSDEDSLDPDYAPEESMDDQSDSDSEDEYIEERARRARNRPASPAKPGEDTVVPVTAVKEDSPRWSSIMEEVESANAGSVVEVPSWALEAPLSRAAPRLESVSEPVGTTGPTLERPDVIVVESADGAREEYIVKSEIDSSGDEAGVPPQVNS